MDSGGDFQLRKGTDPNGDRTRISLTPDPFLDPCDQPSIPRRLTKKKKKKTIKKKRVKLVIVCTKKKRFSLQESLAPPTFPFGSWSQLASFQSDGALWKR